MKIDSYSFGNIKIDGLDYRSDVIVYPDRVDDKWWRQEGHLLQLEDLAEILVLKPVVLIVGQGLPGLMKVDAKLEEYCQADGISLIVLPTMQAVERFNDLKEKKPLVIAALHLTC
jgi:hypothetical protein